MLNFRDPNKIVSKMNFFGIFFFAVLVMEIAVRTKIGPPPFDECLFSDDSVLFSDPPLQSDFPKLFGAAQKRWLKSEEVYLILRYAIPCGYQICTTAPENPASGSLFLFDKRVFGRFRKDGVNWKKKSDGKSVREHHEKLKVNGQYALNCYYSQCADPDRKDFHRRIFSLLKSETQIVFVHYLDQSRIEVPSTSDIVHLRNALIPPRDPIQCNHCQGGSRQRGITRFSEEPPNPEIHRGEEAHSRTDPLDNQYEVGIEKGGGGGSKRRIEQTPLPPEKRARIEQEDP